MNARKAKTRALLRMERAPKAHGPNQGRFVRVGRYRNHVFTMEIGSWENFRFIESPALAPFRESPLARSP